MIKPHGPSGYHSLTTRGPCSNNVWFWVLHFTKVTEKLECIQGQASRTGKGLKSKPMTIWMCSAYKERLLILEELSHGKRPILVFCGLRGES